MKIYLRHFTFFALIALAVTVGTSVQAQTRAYRASDRQVQTLLKRIENRTNDFKSEIDRSLDKSNINGTRLEDSINQIVSNFEAATNTLKHSFSTRRSSTNEVQDVLNSGASVNRYMLNNRISQTSQNLWSQIRADLDTLASYYQATANWNNTAAPASYQGAYTVNDTQMQTLLSRINQRTVAFRKSYVRWNSRYSRNNQRSSNADVAQAMVEFQSSLDDLNLNYSNRNGNLRSIETVLRPAATINSFIGSNTTNFDVKNKWNLVRTDLDTLATYYRVSWNWDNPVYPRDENNRGYDNTGGYDNGGFGTFDSRLTGTYSLNTSQSDNVQDAVENAIDHAHYDASQHDRMHRNLERRLTSPSNLTFEKRGAQVTMASDNGPSLVLNADGVKRTETSPNGRSVSTSISATNRDLTISYEGDRANDYYVTFTPMGNGQLKVTRRVYLENQNSTVTVSSVYDKTSQAAVWNTSTYPANSGSTTAKGFIIPNNTSITATLDSPLSTKTTRENNRFSMTVTSPSQYYGAVIEGTVTGEGSGVVSGRANMSLSFETIRMRDGRTYSFAGIVDQVRQTNGDVVNVNNEGMVRDGSQTTTTAVRAGIGATLGAIIGAIAGGGKGAAIGAVIGGGAGAGTVVLQGRDNLDLASGSQFTITSTAPANAASR